MHAIELQKKRPSALEIHNEALNVCKVIKSDYLRLFEILLIVEERQIYFQFDISSLFVYCVEMLDISKSIAYDFITVVRKSIDVPELACAIRGRKLSVSKARKICPVVTSENSEEWIALAKACTCRVIEKAVATAKPEVTKKESLKYVSGDSLDWTLTISEEFGELLKQTKDLMSQKEQRHVSSNEALLVLLKDYVRKNDPVEKAKRSVKRSERPTRTAEVAVSASAPKRLAERPVQRERTRYRKSVVEHAVNLRDGNQCTHVRAGGKRCEEKRWLHKHHIHEFAQGGEHAAENLETLCWAHHKMRHLRVERQEFHRIELVT